MSADGVRMSTAVRLVARREVVTRVRARAYVWSTALLLVAVVVGQLVLAALDRPDDPLDVVVAGRAAEVPAVTLALTEAAESLGVDVETTTEADEPAARAAVEAGDADLAVLTGRGGGLTVVSVDDPDDDALAVVSTAARTVGLDRALRRQGVDPERVAADLARTPLAVEVLDPADPDEGERAVLAYAAVLLLFFTVYLYGVHVAMGVVEEKSSRVVELLLATIRPIDLLVGKVLGIGLVGLLQVALVGAAGVATGVATGLITVEGTAVALLATVVGWYVLGFAFYAVLFAGTGSLVSRQEEVNAATMPLSVVGFVSFVAAQAALGDPDARWAEVLAWVPPVSAMLAPIRVAAGEASPVEAAGSVLLMLVATAAAAVVAARVYRRSVLQTGGRRGLVEALRGDGAH